MILRARWLICLACLGCHAAAHAPLETAPNAEPDAALAAPREPQGAATNDLSRAAACLASGDAERACSHLRQFVADHPDHSSARFFLAEMLFQHGQHAAACEHFERTIAACQDEAARDVPHLLHCHGRLVAAAEALNDEYEMHLQRGIGLMLTAQLRAAIGEPKGELPVEALLFRAAASLAAAHRLRPDQARPCWYSHAVWHQLAQTQMAELWLLKARAAAPFSYLTAAEQRGLQLADQHKIGRSSYH